MSIELDIASHIESKPMHASCFTGLMKIKVGEVGRLGLCAFFLTGTGHIRPVPRPSGMKKLAERYRITIFTLISSDYIQYIQ